MQALAEAAYLGWRRTKRLRALINYTEHKHHGDQTCPHLLQFRDDQDRRADEGYRRLMNVPIRINDGASGRSAA